MNEFGRLVKLPNQDKLGMNIHFSYLAARVEEHVRNNDRKNRERLKQCHLLSEGEWMTE